MARSEHLRSVGQSIGTGKLALDGQQGARFGAEHAVDIDARSVGRAVAIETQLTRNDADHLGRGLVYQRSDEYRSTGRCTE